MSFPPPPTANFTTTGTQTYTRYVQDHQYSTDTGVVVCPQASRTPGFKRIRLHGGLGFRTVRWEAARQGRPPIIPAALDIGHDKLLSHSVTALLPRPNPNQGGYDWSISGEYVYVQGGGRIDEDTYGGPRVPGIDNIPTGSYPFVLAPTDSMADAMATPYISEFTDATPDENGADKFFRTAGERIVDHNTNNFLWPFTSLPPIYSTALGFTE